VGGHQTFKPAELARSLDEWDVASIGAAGTFVVRKSIAASKLRAEILRRLDFQPEMMICPSRDVLALKTCGAFSGQPEGKDIGQFVSIMQQAPATRPRLPIEQPPGPNWEVRVVAVIGCFALSVRRLGKTYPNPVVEKQFGFPATTRNWNTIEAIGKLCRLSTPG
jgi:hypothetical protein